MIFARHLRDIGDNYRAAYLHSYDTMDRTVSPLMIEQLGSGSEWLHSKWPLSPALGGPYIAVHWRRGDFISNPAPADGFGGGGMDSVETMTTAATASDSATLPTTKSSLDTFGTAQQILNALRIFNQYEEHHIYNIFLSTDSTKEVLKYKPIRMICSQDSKMVHINCAISHDSSNDNNNNGFINNNDEKLRESVITRIMKNSIIK
ncbi:unnamed protein product [Trichobilharzia regenti]|nr:unnamed protein product [Trichobilharzia regenti]